ncbi:MAG: carboxylating nicotinate-nucleotide diphosphorylase [Acidimicrobiales bacterium]|nr:carboxylating nicotinate-nucleotide diphosphorylase [Acidimicrobiales bacterium]
MSRLLHPPRLDVRAAVERALAEDLYPFGDLSATLLPEGAAAIAKFRVREAGVLAGTACADETFAQVDPALPITWLSQEGDRVQPDQVIATVEGSLESILIAERTALNFMGHLSGIASRVAQFVDAAAGGCRVWDTRKTTPGLRSLEKAAVRAGGAWNHRGNLSDWIMLKDNHLMGVSITDGVAMARDRWPGRTVHIECDREAQVREALNAKADALLLDNMSPAEAKACVDLVDEHEAATGHRPLVEASGGITLDTIAGYAKTGVDLVSSSSFIMSAAVLDIGLDIDPVT